VVLLHNTALQLGRQSTAARSMCFSSEDVQDFEMQGKELARKTLPAAQHSV
jgi:hypothetical protein